MARLNTWKLGFYSFIGLGLCFVLFGFLRVAQSGWLLPKSDLELTYDLTIIPHRWKWDPDLLVVPLGASLTINIRNDDGVDHGFAIREFNIDRRLPAGRTTQLRLLANREGEFEFYCSVFCGVGHFDQKGLLIVTSGDPDAVRAARGGRDTAALPRRSAVDRVARLPYTMDADGAKLFELSAEAVLWDYGNGVVLESWAYNGQLPGPEIRVTEGDLVRVRFTNRLPEATTVHWHGIDVPFSMDGVPGYTQRPVQPGETFVYEFRAKPAGTRFYHTHGSHHGDEAFQLDMGLAGAFVVLPKDFDPPDLDYTMVLTERIRAGAYPINGAVYPDTEMLSVREGDRVRIRFINAGSSTFHPMHLHGHQYTVVAVDGNPIPPAARWQRNTLPVLPGETYDVEFIADNPGIWLLHCHELQHAGAGMITAVVYSGAIGAAFELLDHHGRPVSQRDYAGQYTLAGFGYTYCADICPQTLAVMSAALDALDPSIPARGLFFSVDPERDTPELLAAYLQGYSERLVGLTGTPEQVERAAAAYNISYEKVADQSGSYSMDHSTSLYLLAPDGSFVALFDHHSDPARIAGLIRRHLAERGQR